MDSESASRRRRARALRRAAAGDRGHRRPASGLLGPRAAGVADELTALAELVETVASPSPEWLLAVDELILDRRRSPLYNPAVHVSELRAALFYLARPADRIWQPPEADDPAAAVSSPGPHVVPFARPRRCAGAAGPSRR